jgi:hypothetical protein
MSEIIMSEVELENGSGAFLKAAASLPGRIVAVKNGVVSAGGFEIAVESVLFKKLIKVGCVKPCCTGYEVTDFGIAIADK